MKFFVLTFLFSLNSFAYDHWFNCKKNSECIKAYSCESAAVNKKYISAWKSSKACLGAMPPDRKSKAICQKERCVLVKK